MDHKQLRAFLTIAETGNMTRAAELLNLVQPAVSRQLQLLEADIGARLFERERHGMILTEAGKSLLGYAGRAMLELERARAELSSSGTEVAGIVTVGLLPSTTDVLASPLVAAVSRAYPRIQLRIAMGYAGTLQHRLEIGEIDTSLLYGLELAPQIQATPLISEAFWLVGPASAFLDKQKPLHFDSLGGKQFILAQGARGIRAIVERGCTAAHVPIHVAVEAEAIATQKSLVIGGHGFTLLPPLAFAQELAAGKLSAAPLAEPQVQRTIVLGLPAQRVVSRSVRCVVDLLIQCVKEAVQDGQWPEARWLGD